jgi:hypothetical protein
MWVLFNDGFVSAVQNPSDRNGLVIRARRKEHLENIFPGEPVVVNGGTDYKYRIKVSKKLFADVLANRANDIDYGNFKSSVADDELHDLYAGFWGMHYRYQR